MCGTVPPATRATPAEKANKPTDKRLFRRAIPPSTTATPTEIETSKHSKHESRTVPTSQTLIVKKIVEEMPGGENKKEVIVPQLTMISDFALDPPI